MITSRAQACKVLDLHVFATKQEIKAKYKKLVKLYHPDSSGVEDVRRYYEITEAYEYLCKSFAVESSHIIGTTPDQAKQRAQDEAYARWFEQQRQEHVREQARQREEERRKKAKQEEEYRNAMDAINAIRVAEAIKALIRDDREKGEGADKD